MKYTHIKTTLNCVGGKFISARSGKTFENRSPVDGSLIGMVSEAGICWINSWFLRNLRTPFGGMKTSGIGREGGVHSLEFHTELRNVCVKL